MDLRHPPRVSRACNIFSVLVDQQKGFTLLEILVVLGIVAILTGVVGPTLNRQLETRADKSDVEVLFHQLRELQRRVFFGGFYFVFNEQNLLKKLPDGRYPIDLLPGWTVKIENPAVYNSQGVCSGGSGVFVSPTGSNYKFSMEPPLCSPRGK